MDKYKDLTVDRVVGGSLDNNTYIIYDENTKKACIVDPSTDYEIIKNYINDNNLIPEAILITHGHYDHIYSANKFKEEYNLKIYASEKEKEFMSDTEFNQSVHFIGEGVSLDADIYLKDFEEFNILGRRVVNIDTPGHTPGSCCYLFDEEKFLLSGDTLFKKVYGRCDLSGGNFEDMKNSLFNKLFKLEDDIIVYPGHYDSTTIANEKKKNLIKKHMQ